MDYKDIIEQHIRHRLEDSFGKALATLIIMGASNEASMPILDPTREDYLRFVDVLARDQRLIDMWGAAGAASAASQWRELA